MDLLLLQVARGWTIEELYVIVPEQPNGLRLRMPLEELHAAVIQLPQIQQADHIPHGPDNPQHMARTINDLYAIIRQRPDVLEQIDQIPFANTPAHVASSAGRTHFALEILNLKPSFGKKLNSDGYCPLHLALMNEHVATAKQLVKFHPELIRVQGREMITPLHYVAQHNQSDLLAEFLLACPGSIQDLTVRGETAVHVAVKQQTTEAVKVLLGWLQRTNRNKVLNWKDDQGDTVLHIATANCQVEVIELLVNKVWKNKVNNVGHTALNIANALPPGPEKDRAIKILRPVIAIPALRDRVIGVGSFLASPQGLFEKFVGHSHSWKIRMSAEMKNALLVVAVLIVTATYAALLNPPTPGLGTQSNMNHDSMHGHRYYRIHFEMFMIYNAAALVTSAAVIFLLLDGGPYSNLVCTSLFSLMSSYAVVAFYKPRTTSHIEFSLMILLLIILAFKYLFSFYLSSRDCGKNSKWHEVIYQLTICKFTPLEPPNQLL